MGRRRREGGPGLGRWKGNTKEDEAKKVQNGLYTEKESQGFARAKESDT
jgi:hypothetical protein